MKMGVALVLMALAVQTAGCAKSATDFEMPAEKIDVLPGFILKGISISGEVKSGCIASEDEFVVKRDGKEILRTTTEYLTYVILKIWTPLTVKLQKEIMSLCIYPMGKRATQFRGIF